MGGYAQNHQRKLIRKQQKPQTNIGDMLGALLKIVGCRLGFELGSNCFGSKFIFILAIDSQKKTWGKKMFCLVNLPI